MAYRFVSPRYNEDSGRTRGDRSSGMPSDYWRSWSRTINGRKYDFHRMKWRNGVDVTIFVTPHDSTQRLHEFNFRYGKLVTKENVK